MPPTHAGPSWTADPRRRAIRHQRHDRAALTNICAIIVYIIIGLIVGTITSANLAGHVPPGADVHVQVPDYIRRLQSG